MPYPLVALECSLSWAGEAVGIGGHLRARVRSDSPPRETAGPFTLALIARFVRRPGPRIGRKRA